MTLCAKNVESWDRTWDMETGNRFIMKTLYKL